MIEICIFLQKKGKLEGKNQYATISNADTSNGMKISTSIEGKGGGKER